MPHDYPSPLQVLVLTASLRRDSLNGRLATLAADVFARHGATVDRRQLSEFDSPSYDQDVEVELGVPEPANAFCQRLKHADAFVIASPEYNASIPGGLKNLIDWTSRLRPQPFNGKQCLLMSASPSMAGGNRGLWAVRIPLEHLGTRVYPDMFSLAQAHEAFAPDGHIANDMLQKRFSETIRCFMDLVEAAKHYPKLKKQWVEFLGEQPNRATDRVELTEIEAA
jgi:chromate reductase, NAD(P)H dehydrogenase (quinone)